MAKSRAQQISTAYKSGMSKRANFNSTCDATARYFKPTYQDLGSPPEGGEVVQANTSAGILAQRRLVAGLYSNTVGMGRGNLESLDPRLRDNELVIRFYGGIGKKTNDIIMAIFPTPYREMLEDYTLTSAGVVYIDFNEDTGEHSVKIYNPRDCLWFEDANGRINKMMRGFKMTASQAVEQFGLDGLSEEIKKAYNDESKASELFDFIHCLRPRKKRKNERRDSLNMPFESLYVDSKTQKLVKESGTLRFRYVIPVMYRRRDQSVGYSPAMDSLPSFRTLVRATDDYLDAIEMGSKPVLFLNDREAVENADLIPGQINFANLNGEKPFTYGGQTDPSGVDKLREEMKGEVNELHFLDLFQALEQFKTGSRTAYEVAQIIAEKIHMIAPVVHPLKDGCFAPIYEIIAEDIIEYGLGDQPVPAILEGDEFRVKYTSRIDSKMNGVETENLLFAITEIVQAETALEGGIFAASKMKIAKIAQSILESRNIDPELYSSTEEAETLAAETRQAIAESKQNEQMGGMVKPVDLNEPPVDGSPLQLIEQAEQRVAI